jgi:malonyl-CoA/methylmalonyl-CoA synthetase
MNALFPWIHAPSDRPALRVGDRTLTQRELAQACVHHVRDLVARGLAPGDRVGVWTHPTLETLVALVAHAATGYVSVPIDPKLGQRELGHVLADAAPTMIEATVRLDPTPRIVIRGPATEAPALVLYTSGTTGAPKGAVLTVGNIASNLDMLADAWAWTGDDVVVHALPLFHVHGLVLGLYGSMRRGGALAGYRGSRPTTSPARSANTRARCCSRCRRCTTGCAMRPSALRQSAKRCAARACSSAARRRCPCASTSASSG